LVRIYLQDFGPFENVDLELKPLTVFVGKNSAGKSILLYLIWALSSAEPSIDEVRVGWESVNQIAEKLVEEVGNGRISREDFEEFVKTFYKNVFIEAVRIGLKERLKHTFGVELKELIRMNRDKAVIEIYGDCSKIKLSITEKLDIEELDMCIDNMLRDTEIKVKKKGNLTVRYREFDPKKFKISSVTDLTDLAIDLLVFHTFEEFKKFVFTTSLVSFMLPDSRAGITRTLLKPYLTPSLLEGILGVDKEYISLYFRLAEQLYKNPQVLEYVKPLLNELGAYIESKFEYGVYNIYVKSWSGKVLPITMASSGVREILPVVLALLMEELGPINVFIEEPEAHLHPRAQMLFARVIARAINNDKYVFITTHSDYLISALNNLIVLSQLPIDKRKELGYEYDEVLSPDSVATYLIKIEGDKALVEKLQVTEDGIPEDEFGRIAEELLGERGKIYEALESV